MRIAYFFLITVVFTPQMIAQYPGDCESALEIPISITENTFSFQAPQGYGNIQEISPAGKNPKLFKEEHHTFWGKIKSPFSGYLGLTVIPHNMEDDYDLIVFVDSSGNLCAEITAGTTLPITSIISRNDRSQQSHTGLSTSGEKKYINQGVGPSFAPVIQVKKGREYYFWIDNVYGGTDSFDMVFSYFYLPGIRGTVADRETGEPLVARVSVNNEDNDTFTLYSNTEGNWQLSQYLEFDQTYTLTFEAEGYFSEQKEISFPFVQKHKNERMNIRLVPIKPGAVITLDRVLFYGNSPELLPSSFPTLEYLAEVLQTYPEMKIQVEGHVNSAGFEEEERKKRRDYFFSLSKARALRVCNYLAGKGIAKNRLYPEGLGDSQMLYPETDKEEEMQQNRRVEVRVLGL